MTVPTHLVEVAFASDPGDDPQIWTDITEWVPSWSTSGGQTEPAGKFSPQTASFVVENDDRRFDPTNTLSPYAPGVLPMRRIRLTVEGEVLFTGFVEEWPIRRQSGYSKISVTASDGSESLEQDPLPSVWEAELRSDPPAGWYRLGESSGTVAEDASGNDNHFTYEEGATFNSRAGLVADDTDNAIEFSVVGMRAIGPPVVTAYPFTVSAVIQTTTERTFTDRTLWQAVGVAGEYVNLAVFPDDHAYAGQLYASISSGGVLRARRAGGALNDGEVHVVTWVATSASSWTFVIDGAVASQTSITAGSPAFPSLNRASIGASPETVFTAEIEYQLFGGIVDEFAIYSSAMSTTRAATQHKAATAPWDGDTTGERAAKVLDLAGWPDDLRSIDTGQVVLGAAQIQGTTARAYLEDLATTEAGAFYFDRDGSVRFRERHALYRAPMTEVQATLTDLPDYDTPDFGLVYTEIQPSVPKSAIANVVTVNGDGVSVTVEDSSSRAKFLRRPATIGPILTSDSAEVRYRAQFELAQRRAELLVLGEVRLDPIAFPDLWDAILTLHYEDRVRVLAHPLGGGDPIDVEAFIGSVSHESSGDEWVTTWRLFETEALDAAPWSVFGDGSTTASQFGAARFAY